MAKVASARAAPATLPRLPRRAYVRVMLTLRETLFALAALALGAFSTGCTTVYVQEAPRAPVVASCTACGCRGCVTHVHRHGGIYRVVDEDGVEHYTNVRPGPVRCVEDCCVGHYHAGKSRGRWGYHRYVDEDGVEHYANGSACDACDRPQARAKGPTPKK